MNPTIRKFGHPDTLVKEFSQWVVLLRPQQVTLGSLVLVCREDARAFSHLSPEAFAQFPTVIQEIEASLTKAFSYEKINYLMLMMVDPEVHFHVIPRYGDTQTFSHQQFFDHGWPGLPNLKNFNETTEPQNHSILRHIKEHWNS